MIQWDEFDKDDAYISREYPLGKHTGWIKQFALDSMPYYQMLFPVQGYIDNVTHIADFMPQVSVSVVQKGERQEVYMLYINKDLVYYNGVTDKMPYAYSTYSGYAQIGIRLYDKYIEIDSIYTQPFYKHDLVFDIDHLPAHSILKEAPNYLTWEERNSLEYSIWQLDNNYQTENGYIWQNESVVHLSGGGRHLAGPFTSGYGMHFYAPNNFDIQFAFETGYQYDLSRNITRLEKMKIFPDILEKVFLQKVKSPEWILGDTILPPPVIDYSHPIFKVQPYLKLSGYNGYSFNASSRGKLLFTVAKDTLLKYIILYSASQPEKRQVLWGELRKINDIDPGSYTLLLVDKNFNTAQINNIIVKASTTFCLHVDKAAYLANNKIVTKLVDEAMNPPVPPVKNEPIQLDFPASDSVRVVVPIAATGNASIIGKVTDKKGGLPVSFASVTLKGANIATTTDINGNFALRNIKEGKWTLIVTSVGYLDQQIETYALGNNSPVLNITLTITSSNLDEIVVVGYGVQRKRDLVGAISIVNGEELTRSAGSVLMGKVSGLQINTEHDYLFSPTRITLRGNRSLSGSNTPLFVIDGIIYYSMPPNITPDMIASVSVLKGAEATAIYGSDAENGVMVITTKTKSLRTQFRDYAFWQPEFFTDKNGHAQFAVTYPDNVTGWETYVLGMDKHRRMGKAVSFVTSYKPVMAQLSMPQFLLEGDTAELVGKAMNYTGDVYNTATTFSMNGGGLQQGSITLSAKASVVQQYKITTPVGDTVTAAFSLQTSTGFKDGEERKILVFKKGTEETTGKFWVLKNDTSVSFESTIPNASIELYAQNNTLDILLDEIAYLKKYPYYCMEQTSSKLKGLLMKRK